MTPTKAQPMTLDAGSDDCGTRLDRWLAQRMTDLSRARIKDLILAGHVTRTTPHGPEAIGDASFKVKAGDQFHIHLPPAEEPDVAGEAIPLAVVYEDDEVIVIDKPAGLVVHPAAGHASGTLVNALIAHCKASLSGIGGVRRPGIVHRLDKDTTGLLVAAKTDSAHASLSEQFKSHGEDGRLKRVYKALVWGKPPRIAGRIDAPLARSLTNRTKISVTRGDAGRHAVTHYKVLETFNGEDKPDAVSLLEVELETGRTHQIRVHLAHIGHPVLGDPVYASGFRTASQVLTMGAQEAVDDLSRQALHAARLGFEHPTLLTPMQFESKLPDDFQRVVDALRSPAKVPVQRKPAPAARKLAPRRKR